jgi:hypothetical protein
MIKNIDFGWLGPLNTYFFNFNQIFDVGLSLLLFDCLIMNHEDLYRRIGLNIFFIKLIVYSVLPIVLFLLTLAAWNIVSLKYGRAYLKEKIICSTLIILFLIYPSICTLTFTTFACVKVDGISHLRADIDTICYEGIHY